MSDNNELDLHELYTKLNDSLNLSQDEINAIATELLDAPEDQFVTRNMRLQAVILHTNMSRDIFDRLLHEFSPETLTAENSNVLHLLITNENTTIGDLTTIRQFAEQSGTTDWFDSTIANTIEVSDYQLNLTYNGEHLFSDEKVRNNLTRTVELMAEYQSIRARIHELQRMKPKMHSSAAFTASLNASE